MAYVPYNNFKGDYMAEFEVIFYEKENGDCPVEEFIKSQDIKMRAKIVGLLELLEEKGNQLREPYSKPIVDGIFEIRCKVGNNITRVLYFFYYEGKIVLTNGFVKKTQKTPPEEIKLAKERRADFKERMEKS
jgi:phage-related protein